MKLIKPLAVASVLLNVVLAAMFVTNYGPQPIFDEIATTSAIRVAISVPVSHPSLEKIEQGFRSRLTEKLAGEPTVTTFNGNGDKTLIKAQAEEMLQGNYDVVFTVGTLCSQVATELAQKKGTNTPIVFGAVSNPVEAGIVDKLSASRRSNVTGTTEPRNHEQFVEILTYLLPDTRRIGLVYNPSQDPQLENDRKQIAELLSSKGIALTAAEAYNTSDVRERAAALIEDVDVMIMLKDNTIVSALQGLVRLCERHNTPLFASELDSPSGGAAFGFGVPERSFGEYAGSLALEIIAGAKASQIPVIPVDDFYLEINPTAARLQGVDISAGRLFIAEKGRVTADAMEH